METVLSILNKTAAYFEKQGIANARLDAEILLAHVLECKRMQLYLDFERPLSESTLAILRPLLKRRAAREPLQYLIGHTAFMDFEVKTDARALIPRPETEELVELMVEACGTQGAPKRVLDLGTGTGVIACALARAFPEAEVLATDIRADTLTLAQENINRLALQDRVRCLQSDWFENVPGCFDLIVSNPPYLSDAELTEVAPELQKFEPSTALSSGPTGLEAIQILLGNAARFLAPRGSFFMETGCDQEVDIRRIAEQFGIVQGLECRYDLNRRHRFVVLRVS